MRPCRFLYALVAFGQVLVASWFTLSAAAGPSAPAGGRSKASAGSVESVYSRLIEFTDKNVTENARDWNIDMAIMFYAPWCKYCKQLAPSWEQIGLLTMKASKDVQVGIFNCEVPAKNSELCQKMGVDRYPSIYYIGYGNMNGHLVQRSNPQVAVRLDKTNERIVRYNADLYPEALYDWVSMLAGISSAKRSWDDTIGFFTGQSRDRKKVVQMQEQVALLQRKVDLFSSALEKYKADELFDTLKDHGDPYPLLSSLTPDKANAPFRICVAEMTAEYCK